MSVSRPPHSTEGALPIKTLAANTARVLRTSGWCQKTFRNDNGECCVLGAALTAANIAFDPRSSIYPPTQKIVPFLLALVDQLGADPDDLVHRDMVNEIVQWNDDKWRSVEDVLEILDELAA